MATPTIPNGEEHFFPIIYEGNGAGQRVGKFLPFTDQATIANSCIFNDDDLPRLYRQISAGNRKTYTISLWFKLGKSPPTDGAGFWSTSPSNDSGYGGNPSPYNLAFLQFVSGAIEIQDYEVSGNHYIMRKRTNRTFEDTSKWYHFLMAVDTTQSTESDRMKMYIDGDLITSFNDLNSSFGYPDQNEDTGANKDTNYDVINIGYNQHWDGCIAEFNFVDGQALLPASFGITDTSTGRWIPKTVEPFPTTTTDIAVTVVSSGGNKYALDGVTQDTVTLIEGATYKFDQSDSSNSGHPLRFSTTSDGTHGSGSEYTTGVTTVGTPGSSGAYTQITVATGAPTLYYYCSSHSGMGGTANTQDQYGTNGYRLKFQDSSAFGDDTSGNGNDFTSINLATTDQTTDSPTQNHATLAVNGPNVSSSFSEGNLKATFPTSSDMTGGLSTLKMVSGKYYMEATVNSISSAGLVLGIMGSDRYTATNEFTGRRFDAYGYYSVDGKLFNDYDGNSTSFTFGNSYTTSDVIGIAVDLDNNKLYFSKNGTFQNSANPSAGTGGQSIIPAKSTTAGFYRFCLTDGGTGSTDIVTANFGQKSFTHTPPTGFVALQQDNLPETSKGVSGFTWLKDRDNATNHYLVDSSRNYKNALYSNGTDAEVFLTAGLRNPLKGGFEVLDGDPVNGSGRSFVSWNWVANGGTRETNTNGSITSTVQANTTAGFSIVEFTTPSSTQDFTVGHGLSVAPRVFFFKRLDSTSGWAFYHQDVFDANGNQHTLFLNTTDASYAPNPGVAMYPSATTATTFSLRAGASIASSANCVAYCFNKVDGYSKFGKYVGNGSSDGPFIYTGFKPACVIVKSYSNSGTGWEIRDNKRSASGGNNPITQVLYPYLTSAEITTDNCDFLSNGFKWRSSGGNRNESGYTYIYMAWAEHPFVGDGTNPVTAR